MRKSNSNIFSRLTNAKNTDKGQSSDEKQYGEPRLKSFEILSATPQEFIAKGIYSNGEELLKQQFSVLKNIDTKQLLNNINRFKNLDLEKASDDELATMLGNIITYNSVSTLEITEDTYIYRARNHTFQFEGAYDYFRKKGDIWYPQPKFLTKLGRLNKVGQSIMYASFDAITPIHEIGCISNLPV